MHGLLIFTLGPEFSFSFHLSFGSQSTEKDIPAGRWWLMPLILALRRQRQADLCEFKTNLVYKSWFQDSLQKPQRNPVSKNKNKKLEREGVQLER